MAAKLKFIRFALGTAALIASIAVSGGNAAAADASYDPVHTMSALNMAIVSLHRVASSEDRVTLNAEYENVIDNLYLGNIEDDPELKALYLELVDTIGKKTLRQDEAARVRKEYDSREKKRLSGLITKFADVPSAPWSLVGNILAGELAGYFGITALAAEGTSGLPDEIRKLERENVEDILRLQERLLDTSWTLVRRYGLPDEYRLAQRDLGDFDKAVSEPDRTKSLRMLNALERNFAMYAPFWYYRAAAAREIGDGALAAKYLDEFDRVWRPVLRRDPYKAEAARMRARALSDAKAPNAEIAAQLDILAENTQRENWVDNLFAGVMYYAIGDAAKAREMISINVDFDVERDISTLALRDIENGALDADAFLDSVQAMQAARARGYDAADAEQALAERGLVAWFRGDTNAAASLMTQALDAGANALDPLPFQILLRLSESSFSLRDAAVAETLRNAANLRKEAEGRLKSAAPPSWEALLPIAERYAGISANAKTFLADMYMTGSGVIADPARAAELFAGPAESGDAYAAGRLGEILETADGLRDLDKAARYYEAAARQGLPWAAMKLGDMCRDGRVPGGKNPEDAYMWYALARLDGEPSARDKIDELEGRGLLKLKSVNAATAARATARAQEIYDARVRGE